jgi:hypothetical protein
MVILQMVSFKLSTDKHFRIHKEIIVLLHFGHLALWLIEPVSVKFYLKNPLKTDHSNLVGSQTESVAKYSNSFGHFY